MQICAKFKLVLKNELILSILDLLFGKDVFFFWQITWVLFEDLQKNQFIIADGLYNVPPPKCLCF